MIEKLDAINNFNQISSTTNPFQDEVICMLLFFNLKSCNEELISLFFSLSLNVCVCVCS